MAPGPMMKSSPRRIALVVFLLPKSYFVQLTSFRLTLFAHGFHLRRFTTPRVTGTDYHHFVGTLKSKQLLYNAYGEDDNELAQPQTIGEVQDMSIPPPPTEQLGKEPSISDMMKLMGTSPRRIFLSFGTACSIALTANLFGVTSNILSILPEEFSEKTRLDTYYPRGDFKRVIVRSGFRLPVGDSGGGSICKCSFLIPKDWVADTGLALAQAQRRVKDLDYSMGGGRKPNVVLPDAAFGPPGKLDNLGLSNRDTNVSVIINSEVKNFSLRENLGDPVAAAELLLSNKFGRRSPTTLLTAFEERRGENDVPVYQFEYTVDRSEKEKPALHALSVIAGSPNGDAFITLTVVSLDTEWHKADVDYRLRIIATSFKLI
ncbi:hypothetical protein ACHAXS_003386 [Conticribra weissflogii]